jgi:uroporphyrinogen-III decarboxylase
MTGKERLLTAMRRGQAARVPIHVRGVPVWDEEWVASRDPSYGPLIEAVREHGDYFAGTGFGGGPVVTDAPLDLVTEEHIEGDWKVAVTRWRLPQGELRWVWKHSLKGYPSLPVEFPIKTREQAEWALAAPYEPMRPSVKRLAELEGLVGERGVVAAGFRNPLMVVQELMGSELLAIWSRTERPLLARMIGTMAERMLEVVEYLLAQGVGPVFATLGQEFCGPPLMSPADYREFCVEPEKPLAEAIHRAGGLLHCHCHGPMKDIIAMLAETGVDALHPIEPPPMGDITLAEAKGMVGDRVCLEGNIQIGDLYTRSEGEIREATKRAIEEGAPGGGFILAPSASPYTPKLSVEMVRNCLAMIETGVKVGRY